MAMKLVFLEANLTRDPEAKVVKEDTVISFGVAENQQIKNRETGQWEDGEPNFYEVNLWSKNPQYWLKRLGKGVGVFIVGKEHKDNWTDKEGAKRTTAMIKADSIYARWLPEIGASQGAPTKPTEPEKDVIPF